MWGRSVTITRLGGFDIKIDASWLVIAALIVWSLSTGYFPQVLPDASRDAWFIAAVIAMLGLFASLVLHELSHSVVARMHGLGIRGITLFLFGGVAELEDEPASPVIEFRVAVVGPLASLLLAALSWSAATGVAALGLGELSEAILRYLAGINLTLALFNMVPAFPLDGGRVFRAYLWHRSGDLLEATRRATRLSAGFAWLLIVLGGLALVSAGAAAGIWPILLGVFLLALGRASYRSVEVSAYLDGRRVSALMTRDAVTADPDQTLAELVNRVFLAHGVSFVPVVENGRVLGYVDMPLVRRIDRENWATTRVDDVVEASAPDNTVSPDLRAGELLAKMSRGGRRKFLVVRDGRLDGIVTLSDVARHLDVSRSVAQP